MFLSDAFYTSLFFFGVSLAMMGFVIFGIRRNIQKAQALEDQRLAVVAYQKNAHDLLQRAKRLSTMAEVEQPFAVCDSCNQIRTRYLRDENGVTCIECAEKHTERE